MLCIWTIYCLPETKDSKLSDKLKQTFTNEESKHPKLIANMKPNIEDEER